MASSQSDSKLCFFRFGVVDIRYQPGYLTEYAGLELQQIRQLASRDKTAQQVASLTFEEFGIGAAHFPILGLGTTLLLEAMDPERAMAMRRFGERSGIGKTAIHFSCLSRQVQRSHNRHFNCGRHIRDTREGDEPAIDDDAQCCAMRASARQW